jgi:HEAT repeat protein
MKELGPMPKANEVARGDVELTVEQRQELDKVFSSLAALMRLDDEAVAQAVRDIHAGSPQSAMLRDALWNAGTEFAQEELVKLMDFFKEEPDRRFTMIGLGLVNAPTAKTTQYLQTMLEDPLHGRQAKLSLGSTVQHLKDSDSAAADAIVELLSVRHQKSEDPIERAAYLDALGNTRYDEAMPVIVAALSSEESAERNSAVLALRHFSGAAVDDKIRVAAISDPDDVVRHTAISVIADRTPTVPLMEAIDTLMRSDPILMVRRSAIMAGVTLREQVPAIGDTLAWVAKNDPEPKLRELAAGYL